MLNAEREMSSRIFMEEHIYWRVTAIYSLLEEKQTTDFKVGF
jgi:hypothetical protein